MVTSALPSSHKQLNTACDLCGLMRRQKPRRPDCLLFHFASCKFRTCWFVLCQELDLHVQPPLINARSTRVCHKRSGGVRVECPDPTFWQPQFGSGSASAAEYSKVDLSSLDLPPFFPHQQHSRSYAALPCFFRPSAPFDHHLIQIPLEVERLTSNV